MNRRKREFPVLRNLIFRISFLSRFGDGPTNERCPESGKREFFFTQDLMVHSDKILMRSSSVLLIKSKTVAWGNVALIFLSLSGCGYFKYGATRTNETSSSSSVSTSCLANAVTTEPCVVATPGLGVSDTIGAMVTAWTNATAGTTVGATIPTGYYEVQSVAFDDPDLLAANILNGVSIFGVTGTYSNSGVTLMSNMHRDKATTQITQETEVITNVGTAYPNVDPGYRAIPKIAKDDEGYIGGSVTLVSRTNWDTGCDATTGAGGGSANSVCKCGLSGTIEARLADCAAHNVIGTNATWDGAIKGNAGQGTWKLVSRTGAVSSGKGFEVWRDERTKLLWSSKVAVDTLNWCKASGSNFITNNPSAEDDPSNYCDIAPYQTTGTFSPGVNRAISACYEDVDDNSGNDFYTTTDAAIDSAGKGGLGLSSSPRVDWRLPTVYDYKQADVNGVRFVMPDMAATDGGFEWSASVNSFNRANAWLFNGAYGRVFSSPRDYAYSARCVGR